MVGPECPGLSANTITRLKSVWQEEYDVWSKRSLVGKEYVYVWADGLYSNVRLEVDRVCLLVLIGVTKEGQKELVAVWDGTRESELSWLEVLRDLKRRGLTIAPKRAVGDGALGFWAALRQEWPSTREQRCWGHKTANVLNDLPKAMQPKAKARLHEIWMAETRADAAQAFDAFLEDYSKKYPKATDGLKKDRDVLLAFYDSQCEPGWRDASEDSAQSESSQGGNQARPTSSMKSGFGSATVAAEISSTDVFVFLSVVFLPRIGCWRLCGRAVALLQL